MVENTGISILKVKYSIYLYAQAGEYGEDEVVYGLLEPATPFAGEYFKKKTVSKDGEIHIHEFYNSDNCFTAEDCCIDVEVERRPGKNNYDVRVKAITNVDGFEFFDGIVVPWANELFMIIKKELEYSSDFMNIVAAKFRRQEEIR